MESASGKTGGKNALILDKQYINQDVIMTNNDILRRLRYALDINDSTMIEIFRQADYKTDRNMISCLLKKDEDPDFVDCSDDTLESFLDGLVFYKRGKIENRPEQEKKTEGHLTNNIILKKLRVALELKEEDMLEIMQLAETSVSKSELSALFRKKGHKNYKECGDQFLRNFIKGLTVRRAPKP